MEFLNRYIDLPLLRGGSAAMRMWHKQTGHSPQKLSPSWSLVVILVLMSASGLLLNGPVYVFAIGALIMLSVPSLRSLLPSRTERNYDMRSYQALAAAATRKREAEWAIRLTVLFTAIIFPFCVSAGDETAGLFLLGASLWFVLTAPVKMYLDAAEPPPPGSGSRQAWLKQAARSA
ncbi:hypothetical protein [Rhizobium sp. BR 314]|uniref:hypothetical protein n=1 Tax=Rhizobium sp. BR 314 TaxID=3040013 RepID=UPI0039BFD922